MVADSMADHAALIAAVYTHKWAVAAYPKTQTAKAVHMYSIFIQLLHATTASSYRLLSVLAGQTQCT